MRIVLDDGVLLVVDKPSGLPTQSPKGTPGVGGGPNLYDQLRAERPYVGLHHRLDAGASGLVLLTVDPAANEPIARAFREHRIRRTYLALLAGEVEDGVWDRPVDGQTARTEVEVVGRVGGHTAVRLRLHTGRKHQIRVHAALAGAPVLGDRRYGDEAAKAFPRLALHAAELAFLHPTTGAELVLEAPLPEPLASALQRGQNRTG